MPGPRARRRCPGTADENFERRRPRRHDRMFATFCAPARAAHLPEKLSEIDVRCEEFPIFELPGNLACENEDGAIAHIPG